MIVSKTPGFVPQNHVTIVQQIEGALLTRSAALNRSLVHSLTPDFVPQNHVTIVQQIEEAYRRIEDETQNQFVIYVQGLKQHYVTKIISLRSVLDLHQKEISKKESYWEASIKSLQER